MLVDSSADLDSRNRPSTRMSATISVFRKDWRPGARSASERLLRRLRRLRQRTWIGQLQRLALDSEQLLARRHRRVEHLVQRGPRERRALARALDLDQRA